jgi:hypothetical protein
MSPRRRKHLSPQSKRFEVRFARGLRKRLDSLKMGQTEFADRLHRVGVHVTVDAVKKWLSADAVPRPQDIERMAEIFGLKDYRDLLPLPIDKGN